MINKKVQKKKKQQQKLKKIKKKNTSNKKNMNFLKMNSKDYKYLTKVFKKSR